MIIIPFLWVGEGTTIYRNKQYEVLFLEELLYFFVLVFVLSMFFIYFNLFASLDKGFVDSHGHQLQLC